MLCFGSNHILGPVLFISSMLSASLLLDATENVNSVTS